MSAGFLPDPLHPAVVHFPIALIISGAVVALVALAAGRKALVIATALLLLAGTGSAWVALATGEEDEESLPALPDGSVRRLIHEHGEAAECAAWLGSAASLVACLTWALMARGVQPAPIVVLRGLVFVLALGAAGAVAVAGKRGGALVFEHGLGVKVPSVPAAPGPSGHDDDD